VCSAGRAANQIDFTVAKIVRERGQNLPLDVVRLFGRSPRGRIAVAGLAVQ
jgi:hypothetical protein